MRCKVLYCQYYRSWNSLDNVSVTGPMNDKAGLRKILTLCLMCGCSSNLVIMWFYVQSTESRWEIEGLAFFCFWTLIFLWIINGTGSGMWAMKSSFSGLQSWNSLRTWYNQVPSRKRETEVRFPSLKALSLIGGLMLLLCCHEYNSRGSCEVCRKGAETQHRNKSPCALWKRSAVSPQFWHFLTPGRYLAPVPFKIL